MQMLGACGCSAVHIICNLSATRESESKERATLDNLDTGVIGVWNIDAAHDFGPAFVIQRLAEAPVPAVHFWLGFRYVAKCSFG